MPLADIEHAFMQSLLTPQGNSDHFISSLTRVGNLSPVKQLSIYRSNLNGAHQKVLGQIYPACKNILGEEYFNPLCRQYRFQHPSYHSDLNGYGELFAKFLCAQINERIELIDYLYLPDLATLEWHWHSSYFSRDEAEFDFNRLAQLETEQQLSIVFQLSHSLSLHHSDHPIVELWQANYKHPTTQQNFTMPATEIKYCIYRHHYETRVTLLNAFQYDVLYAINNQRTLQQLSHSFGHYLQKHITSFIQAGWITGYQISQ